MTRGKKAIIAYVAVFLIVAAVILIAGAFLDSLDRTIRNAYAVWWVAGMVIEYMETHSALWPRDWDELREAYETETRRCGRPWTFEELRERVEVDWTADPVRLARAESRHPEPPFRVSFLKDGSRTHWAGAEPNELVWEYLRKKR